MASDQCAKACSEDVACLHFTWTKLNGGTCWMKAGRQTRDQAGHKTGAVCGYFSLRTEVSSEVV